MKQHVRIGKALSVLMSLALSLGGARPADSIPATGDQPVADTPRAIMAFAPITAREFLPDPAYGQNGVVALDIGIAYDSRPYAIIGRQADGKVIISAKTPNWTPETLRRINLDGTVDDQFGSGGSVALPASNELIYEGLGSDHRIYIVTLRYSPQPTRVVLDRYTPDGQHEATFDLSGNLYGNTFFPTVGFYLMPDGGWLVTKSDYAGGWLQPCPSRYVPRFTLERYSASGQLDSDYYGLLPVCNFDLIDVRVTSTGIVFLIERNSGRLWRIGSDGKRDLAYEVSLAAVMGTATLSGTFTADATGAVFAVRGDANAAYGFRIDGTLAYSRPLALGAILSSTTSLYGPVDMHLLPDGRKLIWTPDWIARVLQDDTPDSTYGQGGVVPFGVAHDFIANGLEVGSDGGVTLSGGTRSDLRLGHKMLRLTGNGLPDATFGGTGDVQIKIEQRAQGTPTDVLQQSSGRMLLAGTTWVGFGMPALGMARIDTNGELDTSFGEGGRRVLITDVVGGWIVARPDDAFAVTHAVSGAYVLHGFLPNGDVDLSFGALGFYTVTLSVSDTVSIDRVVRLADGGTVLAGTLGPSAVWIARHTADGELDPTFADGGVWLEPFTALGVSAASATSASGRYPFLVSALADGRLVLSYWYGRVIWLNRDGGEQRRGSGSGWALSLEDMLVLPDQRIMVSDYWPCFDKYCGTIPREVRLRRVHPDSLPDLTFAGGGYVFEDLSYTRVLVADANGLVCTIGYMTTCFDANGVPDRRFGWGGINPYRLPSKLTTRVLITGTDPGSRTIYAAGQGMYLTRLIETSVPRYETFLPVTPNYATVCREYC